MLRRGFIFVAILLVAAVLVVSAPAPPAPPAPPTNPTTPAQSVPAELWWDPEQPVQGTLFVVFVGDAVDGGADDVGRGAVDGEADANNSVGGGNRCPNDKLERVTGTAAGELLHFTRGENCTFMALAAAPLDRGASLDVQVTLTYAGGRMEDVSATVPIGQGSYAMERLTVASQYVTPTNSAIAERQAREAGRAREVSRVAHETPRLWNELVLPRSSRITSEFGTGREFNGQVETRHTGVDFAGAVGAPVYAAADGSVALVDDFYLAGNVIYVNHGAGLVTGYFHLSESLVSEGERVAAGDLIGRVGATGRVTGPHLHWLVRYGSISVDGMSLMDVVPRLAPPVSE